MSIRLGSFDAASLRADVDAMYSNAMATAAGDLSIPADVDTAPLGVWLSAIRKRQLRMLSTSISSTASAPLATHPLSSAYSIATEELSRRWSGAQVLICAETGSHSVGLRRSSTRDVLVVYSAPALVKCNPLLPSPGVLRVGTASSDDVPKYFSGPVLLLEVEDAFRLLLRGHHQLLEAFLSSSAWIADSLGPVRSLVTKAPLPYSALMHCVGVADGLLRNPSLKNLYLAQRLVWQAAKIASGQIQAFPQLADNQVDILQKILDDGCDSSEREAIAARIAATIADLKAPAVKSRLPEKPDAELMVSLNQWLVSSMTPVSD